MGVPLLNTLVFDTPPPSREIYTLNDLISKGLEWKENLVILKIVLYRKKAHFMTSRLLKR